MRTPEGHWEGERLKLLKLRLEWGAAERPMELATSAREADAKAERTAISDSVTRPFPNPVCDQKIPDEG
jgi:hypothetical protein